jgi:outer membrane protein insertion porin family
VFDRNISAGLDIFRRDFNSFNRFNRDRSRTFEQSSTGFTGRAGVPLTEYMSLIGSYTFSHDNVTLDPDTFFSDLDGDGIRTCDPLRAGRFLCDATGTRTSSIVGATVAYNSLDSRLRPTRGRNISLTTEFAGLGGTVKYVRVRGKAAQYWPVFGGFIFSVSAEGGAINALEDRGGNGVDDVRLTDRFFLGEPQIRGFDIRGIGPRILRQPFIDDENGNPVPITNRDQNSDDALGGRAYYLGRAELEIPLGSGARELGLRPSLFLDVGALFGVSTPLLQNNPNGLQQQDADGNPLFIEIVTDDDGNQGAILTPNPIAEDGVTENTPSIIQNSRFREVFLGDSASPRISIGIGVNWNSPFGPFRIDFARVLKKVEGDDTKSFSFNVGTQF